MGTLKMVTHTRTLLLLLLGVTLVDVRGQSVVFPSDTEDAIVIENPRKVALSSLPMRWKRLNRLKNIWSERENNKTNIMSKPMDNEVEWGTELFERTKNLCGDGSTYCTRPRHYPGVAIARALKKNKKLINVLFDEPKAQLRLRSGIFAKSAEETFDDEFENVCGSVRRTIAPKVGTNTNNQQRYLVQGDIDLAEFSGLVRTVQTVEFLEVSFRGRESPVEYSRAEELSADRSTPSTGWWRSTWRRGSWWWRPSTSPPAAPAWCIGDLTSSPPRGAKETLCWRPKLPLPFSIKPYAITVI